MSHELVMEQVKALPEQLLASVSAFIKLLEIEHNKSFVVKKTSKSKKDFFALAGKIHLDNDAVTAFREESLI
ncbi:MAG: hypothetical protein J6W13_13070 [Salinivirgaceae bacterium]|nr:hypothetical protein [Salinivirgaceae bacterium]